MRRSPIAWTLTLLAVLAAIALSYQTKQANLVARKAQERATYAESQYETIRRLTAETAYYQETRFISVDTERQIIVFESPEQFESDGETYVHYRRQEGFYELASLIVRSSEGITPGTIDRIAIGRSIEIRTRERAGSPSLLIEELIIPE
jgi:hypothetical protein